MVRGKKVKEDQCKDGGPHNLVYLRSVPGCDLFECTKCGKVFKEKIC